MNNWRMICALLAFAITSAPSAIAGNVNAYSYAGGNVSTSAYTTAWASTPVSASHLQICDTSTKVMKIATGIAGSEFDIATIQVSGCVVVPIYIPAGSRLSLRAVDAAATTGYNVMAVM